MREIWQKHPPLLDPTKHSWSIKKKISSPQFLPAHENHLSARPVNGVPLA